MTRGRPLALALLLAAVSPSPLWAYAEGSGVFDVGAGALLPARPGGFAYLEYDAVDQGKGWNGSSRASYGANPDKEIRSDVVTGGAQYMLDRAWGVRFEIPVIKRRFVTTDENGVVGGLDNGAIGDVRVRGVYSGFSPDMSSGLTFGLKLPTGPFKTPNFGRGTEIGSGSTDFLLGGYHAGLVPGGASWDWFADGQWDQPVLDSGGYMPGSEIDGALGAEYDGWRARGFRIAPLAQVVGAARSRDFGATADPENSGYWRLLASPGLEVSNGAVRIYGDVEFPVYQFVNGNQLVASELYKLSAGFSF